MRIAVVVLKYPPEWFGGTEIMTQRMARHLGQRGHDVHVITSTNRSEAPGKIAEDGFCVHRIRIREVPVVSALSFGLRVLRLLRRIDPDVIHVQGAHIAGGPMLAKKLLGKPYVIWAQGSDIYFPTLLGRPMTRFALRCADVSIALTKTMKKDVENLSKREATVLPNGVDVAPLQALSRTKARQELSFREYEKILLFVGRLHPVKGVQYLIQAMRGINQKNPHTRLVVVGDGEERQNLEMLTKKLNLESRISFAGRVPFERVGQYMIASDLLVLPSFSEGFPTVALETMACGLPIVSTEIGGLPEIIVQERNGFLVKPGSSDEIADSVDRLLSDSKLMQRMGEYNRQDVEQYSWETVAGRLEGIYNSIESFGVQDRSRRTYSCWPLLVSALSCIHALPDTL